CLAIEGSITEPSGQNVYRALKCLDARGAYPGLGKIADAIRQKHEADPKARLLERIAALMQGVAFKSATFIGMLPELERALKRGLLDDVISGLQVADKNGVLTALDPVLAGVLSSRDADGAVRCVE